MARFTHFALLVTLMLFAAPAWAQPSLSQPGPYRAGWRQVTVTRANNTTFTARLFHPAVTAGQNVALDASGAPYPAVSFGHGFFQVVSSYQSTLEHLATHGYLVIATDSEGGLAPNHANFASDLSRSLTYLEQQHTTSGAFLFGALDVGKYAVGGHSMGGGAAILAAQSDPRIDALIGLAAADTNPSSIAAIANISIPVRLIAGSSDTIVPATGTTAPMYASARSPKQFPLIAGGFHCGFQDSSFPIGCDTGTLARTDQLAITRRLMTEWCNLYLKGNQGAWAFAWGASLGADPRVTTSASAGFTVTPERAAITIPVGSPARVRASIRNASAAAQAFAIAAEGNLSASVAPAETPVLGIGQSADVEVTLVLPNFVRTEMTVSARSTLDGGTRAYAIVVVNPTCPADLDDGSGTGTPDGGVTIDDLLYFLRLFENGDVRADVDDGSGTGTPDGGVTIDDLLYYLMRFEAGC